MPNPYSVDLIRITPSGYDALDSGEYKEINSIESEVLYLVLEATDSESGGLNLKTMVELMKKKYGYSFGTISKPYLTLKQKGYTEHFTAPYQQTEFYGEEPKKPVQPQRRSTMPWYTR